jgi:hypothetical protein
MGFALSKKKDRPTALDRCASRLRLGGLLSALPCAKCRPEGRGAGMRRATLRCSRAPTGYQEKTPALRSRTPPLRRRTGEGEPGEFSRTKTQRCQDRDGLSARARARLRNAREPFGRRRGGAFSAHSLSRDKEWGAARQGRETSMSLSSVGKQKSFAHPTLAFRIQDQCFFLLSTHQMNTLCSYDC